MTRLWIILVVLLCSGPMTARAVHPGEGGHSRHHVALFFGAGVETKRDGHDESAFAIGGVYEYRFHEKWGVGAAVEGLGSDTIRDAVIALPISFHPSGGWRLFAGPGVEFTDHADKALVRVGAGYEFHLHERWSITPEIVGDFISGGAQTWLLGVGIGYGF
jgi:hypothetical protein